MHCTLCNEEIEQEELLFGDAGEFDGEYWHFECYHEYYGELVEVEV